MGVFAYQGVRADGRAARGVVEADSPRAARGRLRAQGIFPAEIWEEAAREARSSFRWGRRRLALGELALLFRQFAALVGSGMPVVPALAALEEQAERPYLKKVLTGVRSQVNEGRSLSAALHDYPKVFPDLYRQLIAAAEASGALDRVLSRLADVIEQQRALRTRLFAALTYPAFMLLVGVSIVGTLLAYVVPKVIRVFQESHQALPWPTRLLLHLSNFLADYGLLLAGVAAVLVWLTLRHFRTGDRRVTRDRWLLRMPLLGRLLQRTVGARFARTMALLLQSGVPAVPSLRMTAEVLGNHAAAQALRAAAEDVAQGASVAAALRGCALFPPLLLHMVRAGEQSGELDSMLDSAAATYEADVQAALMAMTSVLEPVMIVLMGLAVGFIVLAILYPIFEMNQLIHL
jgi:general secretion pathway protein F